MQLSINCIVPMTHSKDMQAIFDDAFIAPYASHQWQSSRGRSHWGSLEGWQDSMAGPISKAAESGDCRYVYLREDAYFAGVNDAQTLLDRLMEWHNSLVAGVNRFVPKTSEETEDLDFMHRTANTILQLVLLTFEIERARLISDKDDEIG